MASRSKLRRHPSDSDGRARISELVITDVGIEPAAGIHPLGTSRCGSESDSDSAPAGHESKSPEPSAHGIGSSGRVRW